MAKRTRSGINYSQSGILGFILISLSTILVWGGINACSDPTPAADNTQHPTGYLNINDSVKYVGIATCRQCHASIYDSFHQTGMGQSFDLASPQKSAGNFIHHKPIYDAHSNFYYYPFWDNNTLYIKEYRLSGKDTVHVLNQKIDYIIGSGQHTNSHLFQVNGYIYQAPFTWYAQKKQWDMPPGFENGNNTRFNRIIALECMSCHNAYPDFVEGSDNKFKSVLQGIDCERCHGPGALHVASIQNGNRIDTSKYADYTIVNPRKLPLSLQMEICQRCHLQGNSVLKTGKTFFDFKPGMKLTEVMDVFVPAWKGDSSSFIMASHVERLKMSKCYQASAQALNCITCHNPHVSVKFTGKKHFNANCQNCHQPGKQKGCSASISSRNAKEDNCVQCHMPTSGTEDIPHVTTHDHFIRKPVKSLPKIKAREFVGLVCLTDSHPSALTKAKAYLNYFEKFDAKTQYLDSVQKYLPLISDAPEKFITQVHVNYLSQNFVAIRKLSSQNENCSEGWTCYRVGEAFQQSKEFSAAQVWYAKAVQLMPYSLDFRNKLANSLIATGKTKEAITLLEEVIKDQPQYVPALNNLGYALVLIQQPQKAIQYFRKALSLDPDYEKAMANSCSWELNYGQKTIARKLALQLIEKYPGNPEYIALLGRSR